MSQARRGSAQSEKSNEELKLNRPKGGTAHSQKGGEEHGEDVREVAEDIEIGVEDEREEVQDVEEDVEVGGDDGGEEVRECGEEGRGGGEKNNTKRSTMWRKMSR